MGVKEYSRQFYKTDEVADMLGVTTRSVYRYITTGQLQGVKWGKFWRVSEQSLREFMGRGATAETDTKGADEQ